MQGITRCYGKKKPVRIQYCGAIVRDGSPGCRAPMGTVTLPIPPRLCSNRPLNNKTRRVPRTTCRNDMPSPQSPPHKAVQMLRPLWRKRPPVHPGPLSSPLSAHQGLQQTGALAQAGVCAGAALRAPLADEMVAASPWVHPAVCGGAGTQLCPCWGRQAP